LLLALFAHLVLVLWCAVCGRCVCGGVWFAVSGSRCAVCGRRCVMCGCWCVAFDCLCVVCDVRCLVCCVCCVARVLCAMYRGWVGSARVTTPSVGSLITSSSSRTGCYRMCNCTITSNALLGLLRVSPSTVAFETLYIAAKDNRCTPV